MSSPSPGDLAQWFHGYFDKATVSAQSREAHLDTLYGKFSLGPTRGLEERSALNWRRDIPASRNPATQPLLLRGKHFPYRRYVEHEFPLSPSRRRRVCTAICVPLPTRR